jgi:hypothetical protein
MELGRSNHLSPRDPDYSASGFRCSGLSRFIALRYPQQHPPDQRPSPQVTSFHHHLHTGLHTAIVTRRPAIVTRGDFTNLHPWGAPPILFDLLSAGLPARGLVGCITLRSPPRGLACRVTLYVGVFFASFNKTMLPVGRPLLLVERGTGGSAVKFFTGANVFEQ